MKEIHSVIVAKGVVDNISSGRKVFKFLKSVDEIKRIVNILRKNNKDKLVTTLSIFSKICGFFYYILDNLLWFVNMGMLRYLIFYLFDIVKQYLSK